jgi:hypothetical protein
VASLQQHFIVPIARALVPMLCMLPACVLLNDRRAGMQADAEGLVQAGALRTPQGPAGATLKQST